MFRSCTQRRSIPKQQRVLELQGRRKAVTFREPHQSQLLGRRQVSSAGTSRGKFQTETIKSHGGKGATRFSVMHALALKRPGYNAKTPQLAPTADS